jgi:hypothetical protein
MSNYGKCSYPNCIGNVLIGDVDMGLCRKHSEMARFLIWALQNMTVSEGAKVTEDSNEKSGK